MSPMYQRPFGLEYAVLGFLDRSPQHGYQLHQMLSDPSGLGLVWRIKQSYLYSLLDKFEKTKLVMSTLHYDESRPPRNVFSLTEEGRQAYKSWVVSPVRRPYLIRQEFIAKLFFAMNEDSTIFKSLLDQQRDECNKWLVHLEDEKQFQTEQQSFSVIVKSYRIGQVKEVLAWLEQMLAKLSK